MAKSSDKMPLGNTIMRGGIRGLGHNPVAHLYLPSSPEGGDEGSPSRGPGTVAGSGPAKGLISGIDRNFLNGNSLIMESTVNPPAPHEYDYFDEEDRFYAEDDARPVNLRKPGEKAFRHGKYMTDHKGDTSKRLRGLPAYQTFGYKFNKLSSHLLL